MFSAFVNCFKIPELRDKIIYTLLMLFIARLGANIPLPGVDPTPIENYLQAQNASAGGGLLSMYNMFTGGALLKGALFALGIMPYISASIIFQLLAAVLPSLSKLQQEGEVGRQKLGQYTRYAALAICFIQALLLVTNLRNPQTLLPGYSVAEYGPVILHDSYWFLVTTIIFLTAGTMLLVWIGEQITQRGVGNGVSILITVGILADLPSAVTLTYRMFTAPIGSEGPKLGVPHAVLMLLFLFAVVAAVIWITQALRKIPVTYAKRMVGRKQFGGQNTYLPLKLNYSGVMPIIFSSAILMFLSTGLHWLGGALGQLWLADSASLFQYTSVSYYIIDGILIFGFSYFWVSMMFKPVQIADDLKKYGGYVPGVRPGEATAKYLDYVMTRLTLFGAISLVVIALLPNAVSTSTGIPFQAAQFFGGTGLLIIVGVLLDFLRQIETYLLQRHYDGFLKKGRIKGRSQTRTQPLVDTVGLAEGKRLWRYLAAMLVAGIVAWVLNAALFERA